MRMHLGNREQGHQSSDDEIQTLILRGNREKNKGGERGENHVYTLARRVGECQPKDMIRFNMPVVEHTIAEAVEHREVIGVPAIVDAFAICIMRDLRRSYPGRNFYQENKSRGGVHFYERTTMADMKPPNRVMRAFGKKAKVSHMETLLARMNCRQNSEGLSSFYVDLDIMERQFYGATMQSVRELGVRLTNGNQTVALKTTLDYRLV